MAFFLLCMILHAVAADPSITCFQDSQKCEVSSDNLIEVFVETTWEECSLLCQDNLSCFAFNYFGPDSDFHQHNSCLLLSSCTRKLACRDCVIGVSQDDCTCSIKFEGVVDSSDFVGMVASVEDEAACKSLCLRTAECNVYTYYNKYDPYEPEMCVLLSNAGMQQSALACDFCVTGPASCQAAQKCQAAVLTDGATNQFVFAKSTSTATLVSREKDCYLDVKALAIGGGGAYDGINGAAGGSGYVEFGVLRVKANETLNIKVGSEGETSSVERDGQVLLLATAGHDASGSTGGDGYSGGGSYSGDGGEDGGDADDYGSYKGGHGSGLDIGSVNMTKFTLSPGKGGNGNTGSGFGGGGGGVIVNGEKPESRSERQGEGFGGGDGQDYGGLPGCVLIEV